LEIIIGRDGLEDKTTKDGGCVRESSGSGERSSSKALLNTVRTFGPHKARDIYLQAQQMLIPQENLCSIKLEKKRRYETRILVARDSRIPIHRVP
jgi:uncharacterized protein (UPF0248 family)